MTTRKELIARIQAMQLGTQEMLDAAADDATLIPFDTLFCDWGGRIVCRAKYGQDDAWSVFMEAFGEGTNYYAASGLRPMSEE